MSKVNSQRRRRSSKSDLTPDTERLDLTPFIFGQVFDWTSRLYDLGQSSGYRENSRDTVPMRGYHDFFARLDQIKIVTQSFFKNGHVDYMHRQIIAMFGS